MYPKRCKRKIGIGIPKLSILLYILFFEPIVLNKNLNLLILILLKFEGLISVSVACVKGTVNTITRELNTINIHSNKLFTSFILL
jgi:hypothetical protein